MKDSERSGLLWMLAGFSTLSVGDAIVKGMAGMWPAPAMAATRYVIAAVVMAGILTAREGPRALIMPRPELQWVRGIAVSASAIGMFMGVGLMPLERKTREGVRVEPLVDPPVILTAYAVTRRGRSSWPPLRLVLDRLTAYR